MISISADPVRCWIVLSSSRIWAWIVTSSAVVGSSAMSSFGSHDERHRDHHALAHAAGHLVRVLLDAPLGQRDADQPERSRSPGRGASLLDLLVELDLPRRSGRRP